MNNSAPFWSAAKSREWRGRERIGAGPIGRSRARNGRVAAAVLLAIRGAGADRGSRGHHLPLGLHDLDEPARMEGRRGADLRRPRELHPPAERRTFRRVGVAHPCLYRAVRSPAAAMRHARGGGVSRQISDARLSARALYFADDVGPGRYLAVVDDDMLPATRYPPLPAVARV